MTRKLCVFPNDPLIEYYKKGEIKDRYFNPNNLFDEVHIISFTNSDIEEEKVKTVAGNGTLKIHCVGIVNLKNMKRRKNDIVDLVKKINPDIIRAFNPLIGGWIAAQCSKQLGIPFVLSLHGEYDKFRKMVRHQNLFQYLKLVYTSIFIEPHVIKNADRIICVYKVIIPYAKRNGAKKIDLIYNRVDLSRFSHIVRDDNKTPLVISVGRLIKQKNHEIIIRAISNVNAHLLIIGDGDDYTRLNHVVKNLKLEEKVTFLRSVPNSEIHKLYQSADLFAMAIRTDLESLPIPILEVMASGLPVIIPKPVSMELYDELGHGVMLIDNNSEAFSNTIRIVFEDKELYSKMSKDVLQDIKRFDGKVMEQKERDLYLSLLEKN